MAEYVLDNATLWIGDGTEYDGHVVIADDLIQEVGTGRYDGALPVTDLGGAALSPGMIDLMVLGGFDRSIRRDDPLEIAEEYLRLGVTSCQFCTGTLPMEAIATIADNIRQAMAYSEPDAARVLGFYLEGPFQDPRLTGASLSEYAIPPTPENVQQILEMCGEVLTMINVSPGVENDVEAVSTLRKAGKVVSMAHADAPAERVLRCVEAGTSVVGHIWDNNLGALAEPGVQQPTIDHVGLVDERVRFVHMICDGTHVHPVIMNIVHRCRGTDAICIVTDAIPRAGCPDGEYTWDDGRRFVKKGGVGRTDQGHLGGSGLLLPDHLRNFVTQCGVPPAEAIRTVTLNPAACVGLDDRIGLIKAGYAADLVAWDDALRVRRVWRAGREIPDVSDLCEVGMQPTD